jgi:hypothetical protein
MTASQRDVPAGHSPDIAFSSSLTGLADAFSWAQEVSLSWVQTGKAPDVLPSYWAGLTDRPMFYSRDVAHQALGAHLLGLDEENFTMLRCFAESATEGRRYYPLWAFNFDGTPAAMDYESDSRFVRETPAPFEVAQKAMDLFRWTGDRRYVTDPVLIGYYRHVVFDFVALHDIQGHGLAGEQQAIDIYDGSPTYNEHADLPDLQIAADGVACQWAAMRALADVFTAEGTEPDLAARAHAEAERVRELYERLWWDEAENHYIVGLTRNGRATGFASEASWFPMVKRMVPDGARVRSHLALLAERLRRKAPDFLESSSYLPEAFFAYGYDSEALHWVRYLIDSKSIYPEIPFTLVSNLALGLTGLDVDEHGTVETRSHIPAGEHIEVSGIPVRGSVLTVRHEQDATELSVLSGTEPVHWRAHFGNGPAQSAYVLPGTTARLTGA